MVELSRWPDRRPDEVLPEGISAVAYCAQKGLTLQSASYSSAPAGLLFTASTVAENVAQVTVSGGASGTEYVVTATLVFSGGFTMRRTLRTRVV